MQNFPNNIVLTSLCYCKYYTMCRRLSMSVWRLPLKGQHPSITPVTTAIFVRNIDDGIHRTENRLRKFS